MRVQASESFVSFVFFVVNQSGARRLLRFSVASVPPW